MAYGFESGFLLRGPWLQTLVMKLIAMRVGVFNITSLNFNFPFEELKEYLLSRDVVKMFEKSLSQG